MENKIIDALGVERDATVDAFGVARDADGFCVDCSYQYCECL